MIRPVLLCGFLLFLTACRQAEIPSDPQVSSGSDIVRVCSQNLFRYGSKKRQKGSKKQLQFLADRILDAKCDLVGVQEVYGKTERTAEQNLAKLVSLLEKRSGNRYRQYLGRTHDSYIRNGFIMRAEVGTVLDVQHYFRTPLPRLRKNRGPAGRYARGPLALLVQLSGPSKQKLYVTTLHFKSMSNAYKDTSKTSFEGLRLQMAQGLREQVFEEVQAAGKDVVPVILGDRNSPQGSASAEVLEGRRRLSEFRSAACRIGDSFEAVCRNRKKQDPLLVGLFSYRRENWPGRYRGGSHKYKGRQELFDEILLRPQDLPLATREDGTLAVGFAGKFFKGSDHKLLWLELDFGGSESVS